jgi:type II secretion system protein I
MTFKSNKKARGFTLVENLVAIAILSILGLMAHTTHSQSLQATDRLKLKSLAILVIENKATELKIMARHNSKMDLDPTEVKQGGYQWLVEVDVEKTTNSLTRLGVKAFLSSSPLNAVHSSSFYVPTSKMP